MKKTFINPFGNPRGIFYFQLIVFLLIYAGSTFAQPVANVTEQKKNFGFVKRGEIVRSEYEITNTGDQPLVISEIEISCSCTTVEYEKQPVLPGQKTIIVVIFNTATVYGRQDRVVLVKSNDPKGTFKLRYKGTVSQK